MVVIGWTVLTLVFVDELLAVAAFGVWGWTASPRWLLVWLLPLLAMVAWYLLASPKAPYGGRVVRPVVKVLVFGLASPGAVGRRTSRVGGALLAFSLVVNGLAQIAGIRPGAAAE